ncbi:MULTISPECIES: hypothetical protein [Bacillaceae]|uniref:Uncharacterized protein n=1 Tax=Evansella alkalicola TaxID=745819 RepID=A0ABS6JX68_9BACI|nr:MULTISPECIES: hypothetical protein [Bacillaceae]MBU9721710.1 hypothetical protein [Bacillus alkalicola]
MNEEERKQKWLDRAEKLDKVGRGMQQTGVKMMGCGCLLTLLITIPIILILLFL